MKFVILALLFTFTLQAQAAGKSSLPKANDIVKATAPVKLRASSPDPSFGGKGDQIGWLKSGELAVVLSVKSYISVFGTEIWVEVAGKEDASLKGWIYAGLAQSMNKGSLEVVPQEIPVADPVAPAPVRADDFVENVPQIKAGREIAGDARVSK